MKLTVLKNFGSSRPGDTVEVDSKRADYLLSRKLAAKADGSSSGEEQAPELISTIADKLGMEVVQGESSVAFIGRLAQHLEEDHTVQASQPTFADFLRSNLGPGTADTLINAGFDTPEEIIDATDEELDDLEGIGAATVTKLRDLVDRYEKT